MAAISANNGLGLGWGGGPMEARKQQQSTMTMLLAAGCWRAMRAGSQRQHRGAILLAAELPGHWVMEAQNVAAAARGAEDGGKRGEGRAQCPLWPVLHHESQHHGSGLVGSRIQEPRSRAARTGAVDGERLGGRPKHQSDPCQN